VAFGGSAFGKGGAGARRGRDPPPREKGEAP